MDFMNRPKVIDLSKYVIASNGQTMADMIFAALSQETTMSYFVDLEASKKLYYDLKTNRQIRIELPISNVLHFTINGVDKLYAPGKTQFYGISFNATGFSQVSGLAILNANVIIFFPDEDRVIANLLVKTTTTPVDY